MVYTSLPIWHLVHGWTRYSGARRSYNYDTPVCSAHLVVAPKWPAVTPGWPWTNALQYHVAVFQDAAK